jgi:hypothetical protein
VKVPGLPPAIERLPPEIERIVDERIDERLGPVASAQRTAARIAAKLHAIDGELRGLYNSIPEDDEQGGSRVGHEVRMALMCAYGGDSGDGLQDVIRKVLLAATVTAEDCEAQGSDAE